MEGLKVIESGLVPIYGGNNERMLVNARELHKFLESRREFAHWIKYRLERYSFLEGDDFLIVLAKSTGGRPAIEYFLTISTAKEIAMLENNQKGRQVRRYFIECENRIKAAYSVINVKDAEKLRQQAKRLDIMERNARNRQAQTLKTTAEFFQEILPDVSMQSILSEITALIAGKRLIDLPETEKLYSAAEIGEMFGMSVNRIECIANELGLKTAEYGMFLLTQSPHSLKQVTTFHYKRKAVDIIGEFLDAASYTKIPDEEVLLEGEFNLSTGYL
jgi:phage anti-repressor protein